MFQEARLFPSLAVAETLAVALERHVDVREPLACALAHEPAVLLLDEPSAGIEQRETEVLGDLLLGVREQTGAAFVIIEHDVPLVSSISDRLVCMHLGGITAAGDPEAVLSDPGVISSYLGDRPETIARSGQAWPGP